MRSFTMLLLVGLAAARAQEPAATFRAGVTLVKVDAQVTGRGGRLVTGLTKDDFQLFDGDAPQPIVHFGTEAEPLDLVLLLDVSGSMTRWLRELSSTARAALAPLGPSDRVAVMRFARTSDVSLEFTVDLAAAAQSVASTVRGHALGSGTAINAAVIAAAQYLARQPVRGRRAILIVTDNLSLNYQVPDEAVTRDLYAADTVLNAILIGKQRAPGTAPPGAYRNPDFSPADVFKLANQTGGEAVESRQAAPAFARLIEGIRSRYSLHYAAPDATPGAFRPVRVELVPAARQQHRDAVVRARAGYFAAAQ
jgi:VWFA-related protein